MQEDLKNWEKEQKKLNRKKTKEKQSTLQSINDLQQQHKKALEAVQDVIIEDKNPEATALVETIVPDENDVDYTELVCNLCRRGFGNQEMLQKHVDQSKLHKTNFAVKYTKWTIKRI